ncbi:MAG: ABC transporter ATP-binding protein [Bacteroidia bacterium]|nr:ABC transporter ATP-binding protein [Bacteroidia bacterium]
MVEISHVSKRFGKLHVLKDVSFSVEGGKSVAILGPNGSGKTTLIKSILGMVKPDGGGIFVNGEQIAGRWDYRKNIGYLPQVARFPENLTVSELFRMVADLRNSEARGEEITEALKLLPFLSKKLGHLSGGTRQKVNMVMALMFNPDLYIFDEPTAGLDPVSRIIFRDYVLKERDRGKTILLTTHLMNEVEELSQEIIFLLDGKVYYRGSPEELKITQKESTLERAIARMLSARETQNH